MNYCVLYRVCIEKYVFDLEIFYLCDVIVRVLRFCICGLDLYLYYGLVFDMCVGSVFGYEFIGEVVEIGFEVLYLKIGDKVIVFFNIFCGICLFCEQELYGNCYELNLEFMVVGGIFGYLYIVGGYQGGQVEYVCVFYVDVGFILILDWFDYDDVVLLMDVVFIGYQVVEMVGIQ